MLEPKIKIIFFDVGSVLLKKKEDFDLRAAKYLKIDPLVYKANLLKIIESDECRIRYRAISNLDQEHEFQTWINTEILKNFDIKPTKNKIKFLSEIRFNRSWNLEVLEGVFETLDYLKLKYRLAIISNAPPSRRHFELKYFELEKYFDPIILSGEVQSDKPEDKIFEIALELADKKAMNAAMIDNRLDNLQAAKRLGFGECILFNFDKIDQGEFRVVDNFIEFKNVF